MVTNIPGLDLGAGAEVMEYIPPFQVTFLHQGGRLPLAAILGYTLYYIGFSE